MVEIYLNPALDELEFSKIDHKPVFVELRAAKSEFKCPVVPVYKFAMAIVHVLAVREGNVLVGFSAGEHSGRI